MTRFKSDGTEVTQADTEAETHIRKRMEATYASTRVLGEEFGGETKPALGDQRIVDPLDGTTPFSVSLPMYGTLIALLRDGEPVVGVIHLPALGETISAAAGCRCWLEIDDESPARVRVSDVTRLQDAFMSTSGLHVAELQAIDGATTYSLTSLLRHALKLRVPGDCVQSASSPALLDQTLDAMNSS